MAALLVPALLATALTSDDVRAIIKSIGSSDDVLASKPVFDRAKSVFRKRSLGMAFTSPKCSPMTEDSD